MGAHEIAESMKARMIAGDLKNGDKLPTVRALKEQLNVSQQTVASAYNMLADQGLVKTDRNSGTTVIAAPPGSAHLGTYKPGDLSVADPWKSTLGGDEAETTVLVQQFPALDREVDWGIPVGTVVVERTRIRTIDGIPAQHKLTVLPYAVAELVPDGFQGIPPMLAPVGAPPGTKPEGVRMADWLGWDIAHTEVTIGTGSMSHDACRMLNKPVGTPGTLITNISKDSSGNVLYVTVSTIPMHHHVTMTIVG